MRNISSTCTGRYRKGEFIGIRISINKIANYVYENTIYVYAKIAIKPSKQCSTGFQNIDRWLSIWLHICCLGPRSSPSLSLSLSLSKICNVNCDIGRSTTTAAIMILSVCCFLNPNIAPASRNQELQERESRWKSSSWFTSNTLRVFFNIGPSRK